MKGFGVSSSKHGNGKQDSFVCKTWFIVVGGIFAALALLMFSVGMQISSLNSNEEVADLHGKMAALESKLAKIRGRTAADFTPAHEELLETNVELRSLYSTAQMVIDKQYENEEAIGINAGDKMSLPNMPLVPPQDEAGLQQENEKMSLILNEARKFIAAQNQVMKDTILSDAMLLYPCIATSRR